MPPWKKPLQEIASSNRYLNTGTIRTIFGFNENGKRVKLITKERIALDNETVELIEDRGIEIKLTL